MNTNIPVPALAPVSMTQARFLPVIGDGMAPTLDHTHMVAVVPVSGYRGPGLYVLDVMGNGHAEVIRCMAITPNTILLKYDNPAYGSHTVAADWFESAVLGQVAAICRIVDRTLLEDAA